MRFKFALMAMLLSIGVFAERTNPRVEAILAEADARISEEACVRYSAPGETARYETLLRAMKDPPETIGSPSEDVYTPLQVHENGETKVALQAGEGWMSDDLMLLRGTDVKIYSYLPNGTLESTIVANEILVDRHTMLAVLRGQVSIEMGADRLKGNGALLDLNTQYIRILHQAKIYTSRLSDSKMNNSML
ncbi:MAG: hypothetical protein Q4F99_00735 [bacterium]|nr:hypothetical protein [bacterium]